MNNQVSDIGSGESLVFFELIVTRAPGSFTADFPYFETNLIAVKLVQEEALVNLLWSYHVVPGVAFYIFWILYILPKNKNKTKILLRFLINNLCSDIANHLKFI